MVLPMEEFVDLPKHNDLIYDVGMHKGEDTEFYLRKGFRVVAFEADPELVVYCKERHRHFLDTGQLVIVEGATVDQNSNDIGRKATFYKNRDNSVWGTVHTDWAKRNERLGTSSVSVEVDVIDFARVLQQTGMPHYMKIDIEGADMIASIL